MNNQFRPLQRLLTWLTKAIVMLGLPGCAAYHLQATTYFTGTYQQIAVAMNQGRLGDIPPLAQGLNLDAAGAQDMTLLWYAINTKNYPAISLLIRLGSQPDEQIAQGIGSALDAAFLSKDTRTLQAMLDGGLSPDHQSPRHNLLLQRALMEGTLAHVQLLVARGANVNLQDSIGGTALHSAVNSMQPDVGIYLVTHGASPLTFKTNGASVAWSVHLTLERQQPGSEMYKQFAQLRDLMIQHGAHFPPDPPEKVREWMKTQGMKVAE